MQQDPQPAEPSSSTSALSDTTTTTTTDTTANTTTTTISAPKYTASEVSWMIKNYQSETNFLHKYGLNVTKPRQRAAGPALVKLLIGGTGRARNLEIVAKAVVGGRGRRRGRRTTRTPSPVEEVTTEIEPFDILCPTPREDTCKSTRRALQYHLLPHEDNFKTNWLFSPNSRMHSTNDLNWFKTTFEFSAVTTQGDPAVGGGTIDLPILTNKGVAIVSLKHVIYNPLAPCNILGTMGVIPFGYEICPDGHSEEARIFLNHNRSLWTSLENIGIPGTDEENEGRWLRVRVAGQGRGRIGIPETGRYAVPVEMIHSGQKKDTRFYKIEGELRKIDMIRYEMALKEDEFKRHRDVLKKAGFKVL
ncbi:hypothetical protein TWF506_005863 [Arthrobotrys conoides]|uniref:Uncharacterized protein n=1 Tax=Arthrobotrys conoides TaxID=74498 RepID=A0AAN8RW94_9PEZI